jgi:6-phosphogluconolactonase
MHKAYFHHSALRACFLLSTAACTGALSDKNTLDAGSSGDDAARGAGSAAAGYRATSGNAGRAASGNSAVQTGGSSGSGVGGASAGQGSAGPKAGQGASAASTATDSKQFVYVSGYGPNIHVLELDVQAGDLKELTTVSGGTAPSYMAFSPNRRFAYAINEADGSNSKVLAFKIDPNDGHLSALNSQVSGGSGSPHLAVHPSGKWLAVAHYSSGEVSVLPIQDDGSLGSASEPDRGPNNDCDKAHQAVFDHSGDHLLVPCLGSNYVLQYVFENGQLKYNDPPTVAVEGGPRHLALDPSESHAYVLSELASTITWFAYDKATGKLSNPQTIDSHDQTAGSSAHIIVHPNGKWLYASNRTENSLGLFAIAADGTPSAVAFEKDMISTPRDFSIDPTGQWLILANQAGAETVLLYRIDANDGKLTRTQTVTNGENPTFTRALVLP